ncbi:thrombospondin type 3 repeat protein [Peptoniphilus duerdenii ATCC BAA-1640]|uniref:Thrombospondin type 3 repeat protein n=1 Tax=Peptoniphilus duerdenii ATCC BAA-1640 TaxID=862517 RepID=E0NNS3_9FIRM|nr:Ig-like domain-containing protein [Peptoniphilus duerdenii]EFM24576.1 thrombospondin type 3 repeat protein [Peptoniphilus duerdenii ATCC BAA-1640]
MQKDEPNFDESNLTSSSLALSLTKDQVTSGGIDYKLTSTYDVINGGTVTIKRQKDVVTPKDPHNPGNKPEGYARINLSADALGGGPAGTFTKDNPGDTQRVVDVRAGKPYTVAKAEIDKQGKPFPLTGENKVDTGKTFKAWAPELSTLGTAADKDTKTLNATYESSKVEIIPYLPTEPVPTHDKDNLPIPTDYVTVTFKSEDATKGNVKIGDKEGATVLAKVKPGIDLSQKTEIKTVPAEHYGFTQWKPVLGKAAADQTYTAYFVKSGEEIGEKDPIPEGWFKVTVSQDDDSIVANTVKKAVYPVEPNGKLASDKFTDLTNKAKDGYKDPAWYVGSDKVEKPYEVAINSSMDFVARATELESHKITKDNGLKPVDFTVYKGDEMGEGFWKKGVELKTADENLQKLLDAAKVTDDTTPARTTEKAGEQTGTLKVTFKDGSTIDVPNQTLTVIDTTVKIDYNKDANAPRHKDEVVKGKIDSKEILEGAKVEILDKDNKVIGITLAKADGSFIAGTRELQAGETIKVRVTLPKAGKASEPVEKTVKLNADRLKDLLPIAKTQKENFSKKQNAIIKQKLDDLNTAITEAEKLVDEKGKAKGDDTADNQTTIDNAVKALEEALKALTANIPPTISGPKTHDIFVGEALDLKALVDVIDGDGADDLVVENGSNVKIAAEKVDGQNKTPVTDLSKINETVGTYKVTYTAEDKAGVKVTHEMTLTVKPRTTSAIEVTSDPTNMSYLITEKNGKAKLDLTGMTLNLVDNLGKKTKVELTDKNVTFKVNGKEIKDGGDLTLEDDVHFIEVEYKDGDNTLTAKTDGVLRVGPDYDKDGTDDRTQNFDPKNIEKLEVIKQPQLDYIAKDAEEGKTKFKLNLEGMIVRMTDKAGKEKLAVFNEGKFVDYDNITKEIAGLTATPAHGAKLTPQTSDTDKGHNGSKVAITGPNNSKAETEPLKVFYDANKDGEPDYGQEQKTPAPSAMARNVGKDPKVTTVEGMATPGAVIKITDKDGTALTTEPKEVKAGPDGKYTATIPLQADGTEIKVTAKLGEMGESDQTPATVFDDKNNNKQPDRDEGFNIAKATDIKFVDQPDLTYLVKTKETEVTFNGKDGKGKPIYLELSYKNGDKKESKIMTLEDLMKDTENIAVTPAKSTKDKIGNDPANLVGKAIEVKLVNVKPETTTSKATSTSKFAIEIDADGNGKADKDETTATPTVTARNIGKDPQKTTVEGTAPKGSTVTIKYTPEGGQETTKTVTANEQGKYTADITPKLDAGKEVKVTAKDGEKKVSPEVKTQVFEDKDNDGKDDKSQNFDITKADKIEMVYDPAKMDYLVTSKDGKVTLETKGMVVKVTDKAGVEKKFTAEEIKDDKNFTVEPAEGSDLGLTDSGKPVKVTLNVQGASVTVAQTSRNLSVKLDANGNGVDDEKEKLDLTKVTGIKIIKQPQLNYPITTVGGKTNINLSDMVVELTDGVNKANYTAQELLDAKVGEGQAEKAAFKLELVQGSATAAPTTTAIEAVNKLELTTANDGNKVQIALAAKADVKTETEALQVFEDLDGDGKRDSKQTPAPKDLKALNKGNDTFTTITGKATKGDTLKVYGEDKKEIPVDQSNITIDENGNFTIKVSKDNKALDPNTTVFVTAKAENKDESARIPVIVQVDKDGNGTADKDETTTITSVIARNIGTGDTTPKTPATFTTIEGYAEPGSKVTITFTEKGKQEATTKNVDANAQTGEYKLELKGDTEAENILLPADTVIKAQAKFGDKKDSPTIETKVFEDLNADGKDDNATNQKTDRPTAKALNVGTDPKVTTITGKAEPNAKIVAKATINNVEVVVGTATADATTGEYTIEATKNGKTGEESTGALEKDTPVQVTAQATGKLVSDPTATVVKIDKDGNGVDDEKEKFNIKKATKVEIIKNPDKMDYLVNTTNGKAKFETKGLVVKFTDDSGKSATYTAEELAKMQDVTIKPANNDEIGLTPDGKTNKMDLTVTVTGAEAADKPTAKADKQVVVQLDADGNNKADEDEQTPEPTVTARNIGTDGPDGKKVPATKTTVEIKTEPKAKVTIEYKDANNEDKKIETTAGEDGKLTQEITPKLKDGTDVKVTVQDGEKKPTDKTVKVFDDLDGDKIPDTKAGQTERPAALASNIGKKPEFTTITGEAEKGATVTAKVGNEVVGTATADKETGKYTIEAKQNNAPIKEGVKIDVTATLAPKAESEKQTVVVFKDTDGTGQPDSAKDFDVKKTTGMQVVASPDKMVYSDGDKLNLDGLKVLLTDVNGNQKIFTYKNADNSEFTNAGLSVDLKQETVLSSKDYDAQTAKDGHNGRKLVVTLDTTGNTSAEKAITGQTPTALTVNKNQSAQPTDVVAANQGDATVTKVKGKATKDAEIKITDANGQSLLPEGTTIKADANGDFTADLNKLLNPGTKVFVTATEPGKSESPKAETTVIRDKDGNWKPDTGAKLSTPVIDPIREKDEKVVVAAPKVDDKIQTIEVSDQNGKTVRLTKDPADTTGKTWIVEGSDPAEKVTENNEGKLEIPVKDKLPLNDRDQIKVTFKDGENPANEAFDKAPVQKSSQTPKVDQVYTGDKNVKIADPTVADPTAKTIKVKVGDNDSMTVEKQPDGSWKVKEDPNKEVKVEDGKIVVPLDPSAKKGDVIKVSTINDSGKASQEAKVTVEDKAATKKPTINRANKDENSVSGTAAPNAEVTVTVTPKGGEPKTFTGKADGDGNYKVTTDPLVDGDTVVVKASEPGKADNTSDPKVVGVDTSKLKDSIDKAEEIGGKDGANLKPDENPVDKALKDALDNGKKVKEKGDNGDPNTDQKAVDKAKEDLDKAIAQKEADTAVDKAKDNPTPENIKDAQDKIDAIPGSKDPNANDYNPIKKELQDKLDLIKIIKEAEKETQKEGYKDKPKQDKTALEKAIADGKENLKNNTKIVESTNTIQEKLDIIRMERIKVGVESLGVGLETLKIRTSVPGAKVIIKINNVVIDTITTDSFGTFSKGLKEGLKSGQRVILEASKSGYNDGRYRETVE